MNRNAIDIVWGILIVIAGLIPIVYYKAFAKAAADFSSKVLPFRGNEKLYQLMFLVGGVLIVTLGVLTVLHVTRIKQ